MIDKPSIPDFESLLKEDPRYQKGYEDGVKEGRQQCIDVIRDYASQAGATLTTTRARKQQQVLERTRLLLDSIAGVLQSQGTVGSLFDAREKQATLSRKVEET